MIPYKFLSLKKGTPSKDYWDMGLLSDILKDPRFTEDQEHKGGIVVFPARAQADKIRELNKQLSAYDYVVLLLTGDEESIFPIEEVKHPKIKIYVMSPKEGRHDKYGKLLTGYPPQIKGHLKDTVPSKDYFFSGQITHPRRHLFYEAIKDLPNGEAIKTEGFTQGLDHATYYKKIQEAKVVPAPSGPVTADTFRLAEALEVGRIPIADSVDKNSSSYWDYFFGTYPFPTISNYNDLPGYINDQLDRYQAKANRIQAWWIKYKRDLKHQFIQDVADLTGKHYKEAITVVVPVSPIKSHPSTEILEKCIESIRHHLNCEIVITFDGVSKHHESKREAYEEFTRRALFLCNTKWNATPIIFNEHTHQVGMARKVLEFIDTPTILYVEGDTGLVLDREIDFRYMVDKILDGTSHLIRLHFEGIIPADHQSLVIGRDDKLIRTYQYSQRPHLASTAYYRRILNDYFSENARSFIEDKMHSIVAEAYKIDGETGWQQHRIHIYAPDDNIKYSVDFDGRAGEAKWDKEQIF